RRSAISFYEITAAPIGPARWGSRARGSMSTAPGIERAPLLLWLTNARRESTCANPPAALSRGLARSPISYIYFIRVLARAERRNTNKQGDCLPIARAQALSGRVLFQRTTARQQWIVQRLYDDAVNETVELRLLTFFQHVVDPSRVCTVADENT